MIIRYVTKPLDAQDATPVAAKKKKRQRPQKAKPTKTRKYNIKRKGPE